jgi:hypothetical protein
MINEGSPGSSAFSTVPMSIPILAVTDEADPRIHSATLRERLGHVALVVSCGDLPASYLEFIADALNRGHTCSGTTPRSRPPCSGSEVANRAA